MYPSGTCGLAVSGMETPYRIWIDYDGDSSKSGVKAGGILFRT